MQKAIAFAALVLVTSCGLFAPWEDIAVGQSADGRFELRVVADWGFVDAGVGVVLRDRVKNRTIELVRPGPDKIPELIELAWEKNPRQVAVLVCDRVSGPILVGYRLDLGQESDRQDADALIGRALKKRYSSLRGSPLAWACSEEGYHAATPVRRGAPALRFDE